MARVLGRRFAEGAFAIIGVTTIVFFLVRLSGNPVDFLIPIGASQADYDRLTESLGLDRSWFEQYVSYLGNLFRGDFGTASMVPGMDALDLVLSRTPATLLLGSVALLGGLFLGVPLGVFAALYRGGVVDQTVRVVATLGQSLPPFWVGLVLLWVIGVQLEWLPISGQGDWRNLVMPAFALGWYPFAAIVRLMRSSTLDVLSQPYILALESRGVARLNIVSKHVLKNAASVPLTYFGVMIGVVLTGSVAIETVFSWPGIGRLAVESVLRSDFAVTQAVVIIATIIFVSANLFVDVLQNILDPRLRAQS